MRTLRRAQWMVLGFMPLGLVLAELLGKRWG
jgi:hypothetical protein